MKGPQRIEKWMENTQIFFLNQRFKATKAVFYFYKREI